ncbi:MAG TPA: hypothetical protein VG328_08310 [Stellaceae bacterium]|nr:hypothetical protein [Stellaceae bacterium]
MRATTAVSSVGRAYALAFGLGLAILGMGVGLAHAEGDSPAAPQQIAQGLVSPTPDNAFVCHAQPGGWCDLRDWRGFGQVTIN